MKIVNLSILAICLSITISAQVTPKTETLLNISKGESFLVSESSSGMICSDGVLCITVYNPVTQNFYVYHNGTKDGPYKNNQIEQYMCKGDLLKTNKSQDESNEANTQDNFEFTEDGKMMLVFNGKKYGPYDAIMNVYYSSDKRNFAAITLDENQKNVIVSSIAASFAVEGSVSNLVFNKIGNKFLVTSETYSDIDAIINAKLMSLEGSKLSDDEMFKIMQEINDLQANSSEESKMTKAYIYTESGIRFGAFDANYIYDENPLFAQNSVDNWILILGSKLLINGQEVKDFGEDSPNAKNVFVSKDGKKYAVQFYDKLVMWDGSEYPYPVYTGYCNNMLVWLSLVNETQLVKYSLPF